jgi:aspartate racemase
MYTSGSTGQPKGVAVENRAIIRLVKNTNYCHFGANEVFLLNAPISFDASTFEIWGPLLNGGQLVIMPPQASSLDDLGRVIREHQVTTLWLTAGLFHLMVDQRLEDLRPIRQLLAGGDVLSSRHVRLVLERFPECRLINGYGPTENTTFTCCHVMRHGDVVPESVPIGVPISNTKVYILDEKLCPVGPGLVGELYAAGDGLARGYFNNLPATAERFLPNPFETQNDQRMYRTGDLARWGKDGVVEFLGRVDSQVKILGHRVEPGEVEATLGAHIDVEQACVVPIGDEKASKRLAAYYVAKRTAAVTAEELRSYVATRLPQYMVPTFFIPIPALPLSPNGKVDRSALPPPQVLITAQNATEGQATKLEQTILALWREILRVPSVTLDDNFFDLGGDSLLLIAVHAKLQKEFPTAIQITDLFEFPTIRGLARHLTGDQLERPLPDVNRRGQKQRAAFAEQRQRRTSKFS